MYTQGPPSSNLQHVLCRFCTRISVLPHISLALAVRSALKSDHISGQTGQPHPFLLDVSQGAEIVYPAS